jgi:hypothetical protein
MKYKTTIILLVIVAILSAIVFFFERNDKDKGKSKSKNIEASFNIPKDNISKVDIKFSIPESINLSLTKDNSEKWQSAPFPIDQKNINDAISGMLDRYIFTKIKEQESLDSYGLQNPRISVIFHLKDGTSKKMIIGNEIPTKNYVYVKEDSSADIYLVTAGIMEDFQKIAPKQAENKEVK